MAVKNFVFQENWVCSKVAGTENNLFCHFWPNLDHMLPPKVQIRNSLDILIFNQSERQKLYYYQFFWVSITDIDCGFAINFCIFSKGTKPFDFIIKDNIIQKLAYKLKHISQINGDLIFFLNSWFFKISWLDSEQYGKNHYKKRTQST